MFEAAELGRKVAKKEFKERVPELREALLEAQGMVRESDFPVIVVFAGVDGAGKGETANLLNEWMDPHWIRTRAFREPTDEERERPHFWRFWRDLPPKGHIGIFLRSWYHQPLLGRVHGTMDEGEFERELERVIMFERTLAADGALILKFWMHLGKRQQEARFKHLESDELHAWRVSERDWKHWRMYDEFVAVSERILMRTSRGHAPWHIVEGVDARYRSLRVGELLLDAIRRHVRERKLSESASPTSDDAGPELPTDLVPGAARSVLSSLNLSLTIGKAEYRRQLDELQGRVNLLHRRTRERGISTILVFEGWDAGGKGGAIRRITQALDARDARVTSVAAPTDEEKDQHYLWRFWRHLARAGQIVIFDRSWYGRVLVERVEGFASRKEWQRAYAEINEFEQELVDHGIVLVKFWVHISMDEQEARFKAREETSYKRWKLTAEDWRNRDKWDEYEQAVNDMVERTSTRDAPWVLVEGNDKRYARIKVLATVCAAMERALAAQEKAEKTKRKDDTGKRKRTKKSK